MPDASVEDDADFPWSIYHIYRQWHLDQFCTVGCCNYPLVLCYSNQSIFPFYLWKTNILLFDQWVRTSLGRTDFLVNSIYVYSI
jgi:hypothetical protein